MESILRCDLFNSREDISLFGHQADGTKAVCVKQDQLTIYSCQIMNSPQGSISTTASLEVGG